MATSESVRPAPNVRVASRIAGWGMSVPERVVTNDYFASYLETSDEWIRDRTGISERRWCGPDVSMSDLALPACQDAIKKAGLSPDDIDGIVVATITPDMVFPTTACFLQAKLGLRPGLAFDLTAVCSGFVYGISVANSLIASGQAKHILVVGCDMYSRILNPNDRGIIVIFGDGAGAVVLSSVSDSDAPRGVGGGNFVEGSARTMRGIYGAELHADGTKPDMLAYPAGTAKPVTPESLARGDHWVYMNGRETFKTAVRRLTEVSQSVLASAGLTKDDLDWVFTHQANKRIIDAVVESLDLPPEKVPTNLHKYGNTSAASIPLILTECANDGRLKPGDLCMLSAFGGGLTWGAILLRF